MDIQTVRAFFMWCTIINGSMLIFSFLVCALAGDWVHRIHGRWFPMSKDAFNVAIYSLIGQFKVLVVIFNLVPYLALCIVA